jgi:serine/threonine protein kinase
VYLARHRSAGKLVAIKAIRSRYLDDPEALRRFAREARTVADLSHPNIVRTEAIEQIGDRAVAIIMEYVPGGTVRVRLRDYGAFSAEETEAVLRDVGSALQYAHRRRIVHRDVKPENVFLDQRTGRALLSDFGIARPIDAEGAITMLGAALGTPQYMSPEQIDGRQVDGRSDIYSLGVLGWELLTGHRLWAGENLYGVIYKQKHEALPPITSLRPRVPANLLTAIERALVKDRDRRWQSIDEFLQHLTYDPPPVLSQQYPAGASSPDDEPTVRFRRTAPAPEPEVEHKAPPNAVASRNRAPAGFGRRTMLRSLALLIPLVIAVGAWYVLLSGRSGPSRAARPDLTASTGTVALDTARVSRPDTTREAAAPPPAPATQPSSKPEPSRTTRQPAAPSGVKRNATDTNARCASPSMADQRACLLAHIARNDTSLQRVYDALIAELRRNAGVRRGAPDPPAVTRLRVEQRAWVVARDRECTRHPAPGSVEYWAKPLAECFARVSAARENELRETLRRAQQSR